MVNSRSSRPPIAAIGNFDGVHLGHQQLLKEMVGFARKLRGRPAAVVFDPHPRRYFHPDAPPFLLTAPEQRERLLREHGAEAVFTLSFDSRLAAMSPQTFVNEVLRARLGLAGVVTGNEFRFGKGRSGDAQGLQALCAEAGIEALLVSPQRFQNAGEKISSSAIRRAIEDGDVRSAAAMLGRPWSAEGEVVAGERRGRMLGFPTANMTLGPLIEPRRGVYAVRAEFDGAVRPGVANFGRRPTVGAPAPLLETHIFDFDGDLYGKTIEIRFMDFIRDERKFESLDALKAQIGADCEAARHLLARRL